MYIGDGEDWEPQKSIIKIDELLNRNINMLGYAEIQLQDGWYSASNGLLAAIRKKWNFKASSRKGTNFYKNDEKRFLVTVIKNKDHVWESLKHFLFEKGSKK